MTEQINRQKPGQKIEIQVRPTLDCQNRLTELTLQGNHRHPCESNNTFAKQQILLRGVNGVNKAVFKTPRLLQFRRTKWHCLTIPLS